MRFETLYYGTKILNVHATLSNKKGIKLASGYFASVTEAEKRFKPQGTELLHIVKNTHKFRVYEAFNGYTAIASGYSDYKDKKGILGRKIKLVKVI